MLYRTQFLTSNIALGSKFDRDRDTTSQDSGISQMSLGNDIKNDVSLPDGKYEKSNNHDKLPDITTLNGINEGDNGRYSDAGLIF